MFNIIDRYIAKNILTTILFTLLMLVGISGIIKFIDQLRKVKQNYDTSSAMLYTILSIPKDIELFFPMAALLGALLGLGILAMHSELVVMQASGFSRLRIAGSVMKTAIPLVLLTMVIGEWVAPLGEQTARNMRAKKLYGQALLSTINGLWAKDGLDFVYIKRINSDNSLSDINIYQFNEQYQLQKIISATNAYYENNQWKLMQVEESDLSDERQIKGIKLVSMNWHTNISLDKLSITVTNPDALSITELLSYISFLKQTGQESSKYQLVFWGKIIKPFSVAVMMLLALSFIFGPLRNESISIKIVIGISFGFLFYILDRVAGQLFLAYGLPVWIGAAIPSLVFLAIGLYLLTKRY